MLLGLSESVDGVRLNKLENNTSRCKIQQKYIEYMTRSQKCAPYQAWEYSGEWGSSTLVCCSLVFCHAGLIMVSVDLYLLLACAKWPKCSESELLHLRKPFDAGAGVPTI